MSYQPQVYSPSGVRVLYIFAGPHRKGDLGSFLHELGHVDTLLQFDLQRSSEHDLSKEGLWQHVFQLLGEEEWILIASPPCETFSRVRHRHPGPKPLRSSFYPRGFPWLSNTHFQQVEQANYFIDQTVTACQLAWQYFLEHPEDLGATVDQEVPASIWQFPGIRELQVATKAVTFAVFQCAFEAPTSKPTRFLTNLSAFKQHPPPYATWPRFDSEHRYVGPLPPRCPHGKHDQVLAGRQGRVWATEASAAYPTLMCEWIAHAVLSSAAQKGGSRSSLHSSEAKGPQAVVDRVEAVGSEAVDFPVEAIDASEQSEATGASKQSESASPAHARQEASSASAHARQEVTQAVVVGRVEAVGSQAVEATTGEPLATPGAPASTSSEPRTKAEDFAAFIASSRVPSRPELCTLFSLLPHETPPRASMNSNFAPSSFTTGLFRKGGGLIGLRTACRKNPLATEAIAFFVRKHMPGHPFTTISLYLDTGTEPHRDSRNAHLPNGIIALSDFKGGEVWVECEGGSSVQVIDGKRMAGQIMPITAEPTYIHAYRDLHFTLSLAGQKTGDHCLQCARA